jgi:hypothetical protein
MRHGFLTTAVVAATWLASAAAFAQTIDQAKRVDLLARYTVEKAMCPQFGFTMTDDPDFADAFSREVRAIGLDEGLATELYRLGVGSWGGIFKRGLDAAAEGAKDADGARTVLKPFLVRQAKVCADAAADSVFSRQVKAPPGLNVEQAATDAADAMLESGGLASWQTPRIQARGDLLSVAGGCRRHFGAARSDALLKEFSRADAPRERAYYVGSFKSGAESPAITALSAQQCERALTSLRAKATAP